MVPIVRDLQSTRRRLLKRLSAGSVAVAGGTALSGQCPYGGGAQTYPAREPRVLDRGCPRPEATSLRTRTTDEGTFFVDDDGRAVLLHGVNVVDKSTEPPYYPASEISDADLRRIASWGFNLVRLGIHWAKLSPEEPERAAHADEELDQSYLDRIQELVRQLEAYGVHVLIDMHQDLYSRAFTGDGAPTWAIYDEGRPFHATDPWFTRYVQPAVQASFDSFWKNEAEIQTALAATWRGVADRLGDEPNVVGYDLLNEPAAGTETIDDFERRWLARYYNRAISRIREVDSDTSVWVEPAIYFGGGVPSSLGGVVDPSDELAFSFHGYPELAADDLGCVYHALSAQFHLDTAGYRTILWNGTSTAERLEAVPVMSEFGAKQDSSTVAAGVEAAADALAGWAYWHYKPYGGTPEGWLYREDASEVLERDSDGVAGALANATDLDAGSTLAGELGGGANETVRDEGNGTGSGPENDAASAPANGAPTDGASGSSADATNETTTAGNETTTTASETTRLTNDTTSDGANERASASTHDGPGRPTSGSSTGPSTPSYEHGVISGNVLALVRPYPMATAGVPLSSEFESRSRKYELVYRATDASAPTVVYVPEWVYEAQLQVSVDNGEVSSRSGEYVRVRNAEPGVEVTVTIEPTE